jgi:hypothetical protein
VRGIKSSAWRLDACGNGSTTELCRFPDWGGGGGLGNLVGKVGELHLSHNEAEDLMMEDIGVFEFDSWRRCVQARKLFIESVRDR